jgi:3-oxoacyl-[acyl-carrier protein] reductase
MAGRLDGRVAVLIGAARGIGFGIAARFVEEGARVVVGDIEDAAGMEAAKAPRRGGHGPFPPRRCD